MLAVELANCECQSSWKEFLRSSMRANHRAEFGVSDDQAGLTKAIRDVLAQAAGRRCSVHLLRNALGHLPRKADDCRRELHWIDDQLASARHSAFTASAARTTCTLRAQTCMHLKSTNLLERRNEERRCARRWSDRYPTPCVLSEFDSGAVLETYDG